ncbi:methyltransferase domain-containing protein [Mariprofundus sp. EBB-1]|uniref:transcription antitermination factor NusB n=1 Tax=Mariprofundus sp. EBB-1 TaxID=2650971 RepID=UPI000EF1FEB6|nr:transcription antitermination factor NusB [Mariprofundus sp. EBB-1]RLL51897.1 methyltransferase domain-containing protein [Mariprofundus sp. EBB-1]
MQVRKAAIECLKQVLHNEQKADVVMQRAAAHLELRDRKLLHECVYGVLRRSFSLEADFSRFIKTKPDDFTYAALAVGTYQLRHMRVPVHAAVSETVSAIKQLSPKAAPFVNAVLRKVSVNQVPKKLKPNQRAELPKWIYAQWRDAFGAEEVQSLGAALKTPPKLSLALFVGRDTWMAEVQASGIDVEAGALSPFAVLLPSGTDVTALPGFDAGAFTVMDQAAQAAVMALKLPDDFDGLLLDVCAAPGGKTALLAHRFPKARIVAVELSEKRIPRLQENLKRLHCEHVEILQGDAMELSFEDNSVDAIFLDAACSASGILRRHPDAKYLQNQEAVNRLSQIQGAMMNESLRVLKVDNSMIYAVCSIHTQENEEVFDGLKHTLTITDQTRLLPSMDHDGFFHACVTKCAA